MLRTEERRERDVGILEQPIGGMRKLRVNRRRVADQPDTASGDEVTIGGEQSIDAGRDEPLANGRGNRHRQIVAPETVGRLRNLLEPIKPIRVVRVIRGCLPGLAASRAQAHLVGQRLCEETRAEGIREDVAPESVEDFPIVADEDDIPFLLDDVGDGVPGKRRRSGTAGEDRAESSEDQPSARLRGIIGHRRGRGEMTRLCADDAVTGFDDRQSFGRHHGLQTRQVLQPIEHLALDFDFFLWQRQAVQIRQEGGERIRLRRGSRRLPPPPPFLEFRVVPS